MMKTRLSELAAIEAEQIADRIRASWDVDAFTSLRVLEQFYRERGLVDVADYMADCLRPFSVDHLDGNPHNNAPANCRIVWREENASSPYLRQPTLSAKDRALKIAVNALEAIDRQYDSAFARDELGRIRTLVPEIG